MPHGGHFLGEGIDISQKPYPRLSQRSWLLVPPAEAPPGPRRPQLASCGAGGLPPGRPGSVLPSSCRSSPLKNKKGQLAASRHRVCKPSCSWCVSRADLLPSCTNNGHAHEGASCQRLRGPRLECGFGSSARLCVIGHACIQCARCPSPEGKPILINVGARGGKRVSKLNLESPCM